MSNAQDCHHGNPDPCPLCEANREVGEAWSAEAIAAELAMSLANALDAEHSQRRRRILDALRSEIVQLALARRMWPGIGTPKLTAAEKSDLAAALAALEET